MNGQTKRTRVNTKRSAGAGRRECGFTLLETTIALVLMMVVCLGTASLFSYSVYYNSGGYDRAQALAIAQQAVETLRSYHYSVSSTDPLLLATPAPITQTVYRGNPPGTPGGRSYTLQVSITDAPSGSFKTIRVIVTPNGAGQKWATGATGSVTLETIRARTND
ncbi:MAG TPA: prepilin-type N-terminal cleavage/methylation domain-containing protein [Pyrinomonadaceae bacterium]|jgi:type II secretory pathway pseudopilin PulG